jgi:hypothetical protein
MGMKVKNIENILGEGGPGSGVSYRNTAPIGMPISEFVTVASRKGVMKNMAYDEQDIPLDQIKAVAQQNYVPKKVEKMMLHRAKIMEKPIDVLYVPSDNGYHLMDGHHRYLVAQKLNMDSLPARVYRQEKGFSDYKADNPDKWDDMARATRTTKQAKNPGLKDMYADKMIGLINAASALENCQFSRAKNILGEAKSLKKLQRKKRKR